MLIFKPRFLVLPVIALAVIVSLPRVSVTQPQGHIGIDAGSAVAPTSKSYTDCQGRIGSASCALAINENALVTVR